MHEIYTENNTDWIIGCKYIYDEIKICNEISNHNFIWELREVKNGKSLERTINPK